MTKPLSPVTSPATAQNGSSVRICGVDYQDCEVIRDGDQSAIKTRAKEFWLSPVCDENGAKVERLQLWLPREIRRITFQLPDLTKEFPETVKRVFNRRRAYCKRVTTLQAYRQDDPAMASQVKDEDEFQRNRKRMLSESLQDFARSPCAREDVWKWHATRELADQRGYLGADDEPEFGLHLRIAERRKCGQPEAQAVVNKLKYKMIYDGEMPPQFIYLDAMKEETRPALDVVTQKPGVLCNPPSWHSEGYRVIYRHNKEGDTIDDLTLDAVFCALCQILSEQRDQRARYGKIESMLGARIRKHEQEDGRREGELTFAGNKQLREILRRPLAQKLKQWGVLRESAKSGREKYLILSAPEPGK